MARSPIRVEVVVNRLPQITAAVSRAAVRMVTAERDALVRDVRANLSVRSGFNRANTVGTPVVMQGDTATAALEQRAHYARYVEEGTRYMAGQFRVAAVVHRRRQVYPHEAAQALQEAVR